MGYDGLAQARRQDHPRDAPPPSSPIRSACGSARDICEYDRLIVSPGVDFQWDQVEGLAQNQDKVLHAWKAGPQTVRARPADRGHARRRRLRADASRPSAYRCPPGPYERTCQVAWYLKTNKPRSKLIVLDANQNIVSKTALFRAAWQAYPNIDYRAREQASSAWIRASKEVRTEFDKISTTWST